LEEASSKLFYASILLLPLAAYAYQETRFNDTGTAPDFISASLVFLQSSVEAIWSRIYIHYTNRCGINTAQIWHFADCTACGSLPPRNTGTGDSDTLLCDQNGCTEEVVKAIVSDLCSHSPIVLEMARDGFAFSDPEGAV